MRERELQVAREIAHAFLTAGQPLEVYRLALARVTPLVGASFASVFLRDGDDSEALRLACAYNWPQRSARFLSRLRIRVGRGPTGRAVAERRPVEVSDVFADARLEEWWQPARELGFAGLIALPLGSTHEAAGALTFYFERARSFDEDERRLLGLTADQLAATVEKAQLIEDLQAANQRLGEKNRELARRMREAEEARRLKTEFLSNISHEFRTPLTAILGYVELLGTSGWGDTGDRARQQALTRIEAAARDLLELVSDLLALSELNIGGSRVEWRRVDAAALAERAAEALGGPPEGVEFRIERPDRPFELWTDGDKAEKVLKNLIANAFKFTAAGSVTVGIRAPDDGQDAVDWHIEDTGDGIAAAELGAIFDEFRQLDGSPTRRHGGVGLGLTLSHRIARLLGGSIGVRSVPGRGSSFRLRLPRRPPSDLAPALGRSGAVSPADDSASESR